MKLKTFQCACGALHERGKWHDSCVRITCECSREDRCWPPSTATDPVHDGLTWRHMPGPTKMDRVMNFALFRRGAITRDYVMSCSKARAAINVLGSGRARRAKTTA